MRLIGLRFSSVVGEYRTHTASASAQEIRSILADDPLSFLRSAALVARPLRSRKPNSFKQMSSPLCKCFDAHFDHFTAMYPRDY